MIVIGVRVGFLEEVGERWLIVRVFVFGSGVEKGLMGVDGLWGGLVCFCW